MLTRDRLLGLVSSEWRETGIGVYVAVDKWILRSVLAGVMLLCRLGAERGGRGARQGCLLFVLGLFSLIRFASKRSGMTRESTLVRVWRFSISPARHLPHDP